MNRKNSLASRLYDETGKVRVRLALDEVVRSGELLPYLQRRVKAMVQSVFGIRAHTPRVMFDQSVDTACTDGSDILCNPFICFTKGLQIHQQISVLLGVIMHETGHILYTDFASKESLYKTLERKELPFVPDGTYTRGDKANAEAIGKALREDGFPDAVWNVYALLLNIIEDSHIEPRLIQDFPGWGSVNLGLFRQVMAGDAPWADEYPNDSCDLATGFTNVLLYYAKFGILNYSVPCPVVNTLRDAEPLIEPAITDMTCTNRAKYTWHLFVRLWSVYEPVVRERAEFEKMIRELSKFAAMPFKGNGRSNGKQKTGYVPRNGPSAQAREATRKKLLQDPHQDSTPDNGQDSASNDASGTTPGGLSGSAQEDSAASPDDETMRVPARDPAQDPAQDTEQNGDDNSAGNESPDTEDDPSYDTSDDESYDAPEAGFEQDDDEPYYNSEPSGGTQNGSDFSGNDRNGKQKDTSEGMRESGGAHDLSRLKTDNYETGRITQTEGEASENEDGAEDGLVFEPFDEEGEGDSLESVEVFLRDISEKIASETLERELEDNIRAEAAECRRELAKNRPIHRNTRFDVSRACTGESARNRYEAIIANSEVSAAIATMKRLFANLFKERNWSVRRASGTQITTRKIYREETDGKIFVKKGKQKGKVCLAMRIDESGSMSSNNRAQYARIFAIIMHEVCSEFGVPMIIYGDTSHRSECTMICYSTPRSVDGNDKYRLADIDARNGCNRDGAAIYYIGKELAQRPEPVKIFLSISDGQPNSDNYCGSAAEMDIHGIVSDMRRQGVIALAAAIGDDKPAIQRCYGEGFLDVSDIKKLPLMMYNIIKAKIKR